MSSVLIFDHFDLGQRHLGFFTNQRHRVGTSLVGREDHQLKACRGSVLHGIT